LSSRNKRIGRRSTVRGKIVEEARLRLATIVESSDDAIISKNLDAIITSWNAGAQRIFGYSEKDVVGQPITILITPELRAEESSILETLKRGERVDHYETIRVTKAGRRVNVSLCISPIRNASGKVIGYSKIARDITERKLAEQALADMTRKLIEAKEQERARIGRELHDNINQRLAMVGVGLEQLQDNPSEVQRRVQLLRQEMLEISSEVQALSHELHSSKLEYLGGVGGIRSWCKEFSERQRIEIDFRSDVSSALPSEIGLCLFRVLQEALHNAVKYSGVKRIQVQMAERPNEVHLAVIDSGRGFDVELATQGRGLGLMSMQERVKLVNGKFLVESKPMEGTRIQASLPLRELFPRAVGQ